MRMKRIYGRIAPVVTAVYFMGACAALANGQARSGGGSGEGQETASASPAIVHLTAEQDRQRMLGLLGLSESQLRRRPESGAKSPNATNYDEAKADVYPNLPDPLRMKNGKRVTTAKQWFAERRPELIADFEREIYGRAPEHLPKVSWSVLSAEPSDYDGIPIVTKRLRGHVDNSSYPAIEVNLDMILVLPAHAAGPVPVMLELAFSQDFDSAAAHPEAPVRLSQYGLTMKPAIERGVGLAVLSPSSVQADNGAGLTEGIIGLMNKGQPRKLDEWGALRAWAWGASRAFDALAADPAVDAKRIGITGHSRFGKASLLAMVYEPRFVVAYISSSGEGGAKLYRHIYGEQMPNLAGPTLYHWMSGNYLRYAGPLTPADLPVDNHELIALCAPRPVFIGGGSSLGDGYADPRGDAWADAKGMFLAEVAAGPVYRLLGKKDLGTIVFPPMGTALTDGDLAFRQHDSGHTPEPNWPIFLDYAKRYFNAPAAGK